MPPIDFFTLPIVDSIDYLQYDQHVCELSSNYMQCESEIDKASALLDAIDIITQKEKGNALKELSEIQLTLNAFSEMTTLGIDQVTQRNLMECSINKNDDTLKKVLSLNKLCQMYLLRPSGSERQQMDDNKYVEHREELTHYFTVLGLIDKIEPTYSKIDALLILGAAQREYTSRLQFALDHLDPEKNEVGTVYLLGGERPLWALYEPVAADLVATQLGWNIGLVQQEMVKIAKDVFADRIKQMGDKFKGFADPEFAKGLSTEQVNLFRSETIDHFEKLGVKWPTETDMMLVVSDSKEVSLRYKVVEVDTPMQFTKDHKPRRPNTENTLVTFKNEHAQHLLLKEEEKAVIVAVSGGLHKLYQYTLIKKHFPDDKFITGIVGKGVNKETYNVLEAGDAIARTIFAGMEMTLKEVLDRCDKSDENYVLQTLWFSNFMEKRGLS